VGDRAGAELLAQVSPIAWQHINFYGRYEFSKGPTPINLDAIVEELAQRPIVLTPEESQCTFLGGYAKPPNMQSAMDNLE
jgi:hypothetical protein